MRYIVKRIIAKAFFLLSITGPDIQHAADTLQFCASRSSGVKAAIHCIRTVFSDKNSEGFFTCRCQQCYLTEQFNIQYTYPAFSIIFINTYHFQFHCMLMVMWFIPISIQLKEIALTMPLYCLQCPWFISIQCPWFISNQVMLFTLGMQMMLVPVDQFLIR